MQDLGREGGQYFFGHALSVESHDLLRGMLPRRKMRQFFLEKSNN